MSKLMSAIEGISDKHIERLAFNHIPKKTIPLWVKVGTMVASLVLITLSIRTIVGIIPPTDSSDGYRLDVIINDKVYVIAPNNYVASELPEGYVHIGSIKSNDSTDRGTNGYATGCKVGENIFQNPTNPDDIYVYTKLLSGNDEYRYIRFVDLDTDYARGL